MHVQSEFGEHGGFDAAGAMCLAKTGRIDNLDVIGFVARHHLIAGNAIEHGVHDGPLGRGFSPAMLRFLVRKFDDLRDAEIAVQFAVHHKDSAPYDVAGLGDTLDGAAAEPEIDRKSTRLNSS